MGVSSVSEFYNGRSIFITGASGFMGKVLVEKLLRCCTGIDKIFVLMRPKKGQDVAHRLKEMLKSQMFDKIRGSSPELLTKVVAMKGDITLPALGLSSSETALLIETVSVVFHMAATIRFDELLKLSIEMNVIGTMRIVELCHKLKDLAALVHVSTAYCNCDRKEIDELIYKSSMEPSKLISLITDMEDEEIIRQTPSLIGRKPNTYVFTKALAENLLAKEADKLPISIVRPSIVCAALEEPLPGWVDNLNAITGMIVSVGKGFLRNFHCNPDFVSDIVPVDIPINLMIVAAWHTAMHREESLTIFNSITGAENPIKWSEIKRYGLGVTINHPMEDTLWYPSINFIKSKSLHSTISFLSHWIPAYTIDFASQIIAKKPVMTRIYQKIFKVSEVLEYFSNRQWKFSNKNVQKLSQRLSKEDKKTFNFSVTKIDWPSYIAQYVKGCRAYVLKEDTSTLTKSKRRITRLWWIKETIKVGCVLAIWRLSLF